MNLKQANEILLKDEEYKKEYCIPDAMEIRFLRIKEGLTQKKLAELVGTKQEGISRLENNSDQITLRFIGKVAYHLGYRARLEFDKL